MKICIDAHSLGDNSGGNETYYRNIINNMFQFLDSNDELLILLDNETEQNKINIKGMDNIKIVTFKSSNPVIRYTYEIPKIVKEYKVDVLHTQYYAPIIKNCKLVVTIHDISFVHFPNCFNKIELIRNKLWIKYTTKKTDAILTVSNFSKDDMVKEYKVNPSKIHVTPLAPAKWFEKVNDLKVEEVREKFNIEGKYILAVGNLQPRKNLIALINAYSKFKNDNLDYKLVIVGKKAWKYDDIFSTINNSNFDKDIILTDYVSDEELVGLYNGAEFFVYPSIFEGFGLPVIEAMACGTPVIASNISSLPEVAGDAAVLINPYDIDDIVERIRELAMNTGLREELTQKGISRAKEFSWSRTAKEVMNVYKELGKNMGEQYGNNI